MDRYTFIKCETNFPAWFIAHREYEPQIYKILYDGQLVGWLTDQYKKDNWRIFTKLGGVQIQPWGITMAMPLSQAMEYVQTLPGTDFIKFDYYVYVEVKTEFGMTMFVAPESESGYCYLSHTPHFMTRSKAEKIDFEKDVNRNPTLDGDKIKSIEIKSIGVVA